MTDKLPLPCPFCGGKPYTHENDPWMDDREHNHVGCKDCWIKITGKTLADAIDRWNTRAKAAAMGVR